MAKLGLIKIIKTPEGPGPVWERQGFLGLILPCLFYGIAEGAERDTKGVVTKGRRKPKYHVCQKAALEEMMKKSPRTALAWGYRGFPQINGCFAFLPEEVEVIKEPPQQTLEHWDELDHPLLSPRR